jgi:hypothetical protein
MRCFPCRLRYTISVAASLVQAAVGCAVHPHVHGVPGDCAAAADPAACLAQHPVQAAGKTSLGCGALWMVINSCFSSLTFRCE